MASDRIFGLVMLLVALGYIASATQIQTNFLADPVGPKAFPIGIGVVAALCALYMIVKPDPDPEWPSVTGWGALAIATATLTIYAYLLKPLGFIVPTIFAAGIISYMISPRIPTAIIAGLGLAFGLFFVFKFMLDLGLVGVARKAEPYLFFLLPIIDGMDWVASTVAGWIPEFEAAPPAGEPEAGGD